MLRDIANIRQSLLHNDSPDLSPGFIIDRLLQHADRYAVPPVRLLQSENPL